MFEAELIFLLFYLLNWVSDTIIVVVKYGSNEHVHPISLSGVLLHQCSLKVTPYSWDREIGEGGRKERDMGIWEWDGSWSVFRTGLAWVLFSDKIAGVTLEGISDLLLNAGYIGTVLVMRTASYFFSVVEDKSVNKNEETWKQCHCLSLCAVSKVGTVIDTVTLKCRA